jgi:hypothetical protein
MSDIADTQADEIAAAKLAVDGQVEHSKITDGMRVLKVDADGPDVLRLQRGLLADTEPSTALGPSTLLLIEFDVRFFYDPSVTLDLSSVERVELIGVHLGGR